MSDLSLLSVIEYFSNAFDAINFSQILYRKSQGTISGFSHSLFTIIQVQVYQDMQISGWFNFQLTHIYQNNLEIKIKVSVVTFIATI